MSSLSSTVSINTAHAADDVTTTAQDIVCGSLYSAVVELADADVIFVAHDYRRCSPMFDVVLSYTARDRRS